MDIRARLAEISAKIENIDLENATDEQVNEIDGLHAEFETLNAKLQAQEKLESMKAKTTVGTGRKTGAPAPAAAATRIEIGASYTDRFGGFRSSGDYLMAVKDLSAGKRAPQFSNVYYEKNAEDGGMLVPEEISNAILKKLESDESLLPQTRKFTVSGNSLTLPIDESQPWNSGVQAYWVSEGSPYTESKGKLTSASWRLHKLGAMVKVTDELLEDTTALQSYILNAAPAAINQKINGALLSGDGVGKPQGILNSPFRVVVPKVSGQAAGTINAQNVIAMMSRLLPGSMGKAVWLCNAAVPEQLLNLQNAQGQYLMLGAGNVLNQTPFATLLGRPIMPMLSSMPQLGTEGDLVLVDWDYYYAIVKGGQDAVKQAQSIHLHFDRDITAFKFTTRIDGSVPFKAPVTSEFGNYQMSGIVSLASRP